MEDISRLRSSWKELETYQQQKWKQHNFHREKLNDKSAKRIRLQS
jgi:hypothetical protein